LIYIALAAAGAHDEHIEEPFEEEFEKRAARPIETPAAGD
jgi:hypothetical protein